MKILFLYEKNKAYNSFKYFTERIKNEFDKLTTETEILSIGSGEAAVSDLKSLYGRKYDYVIDVAGVFLNKKDSDGEYCYNRIAGRKIHYVIDHPLYLRKILSCPIKDMICVCVDNDHADFIKRYYPHIKKLIVNPLGGECAENPVIWDKRKSNLLFSGTYSNPEMILHGVKKEGKEYVLLFEKMTRQMLFNPATTQEEALKEELKEIKIKDYDEGCEYTIPGLLEKLYFADFYIRAVIREEIILSCLRKGINIDLYGFGWELFVKKLSLTEPELVPYINIKGLVDYEDTPRLFSEYKFVLNQMPWFKSGLHDRIPLAVRNGCICFTDSSAYLEKLLENELKDDKSIIPYSLENLEEDAGKIKKIMEDKISEAVGEDKQYTVFSWENHVKKLIGELGMAETAAHGC